MLPTGIQSPLSKWQRYIKVKKNKIFFKPIRFFHQSYLPYWDWDPASV